MKKTKLSQSESKISKEIAEKNELNQILFNNAPIGLTIFDDNLVPTDCNDAILAMFGGIPKEFYLEHFFNLSPEYQPDGTKSSDKTMESFKYVLKGETLKTNWTHRSPTGESIPCEITLTRAKSEDRYILLAYTYDLRPVMNLREELSVAKAQIYKDTLTGIHNRRYLDENLAKSLSLHSRSNMSIGLMMIDVDFFKLYNDNYGHQKGDECLVKIAEVLSSCVKRSNDFIARYGGEEFVVVLPSTDENGVRTVAQNILQSIREADIPHDFSKIAKHITVSIGAVCGTVSHGDTKEAYIRLADEKLYDAKENGRDMYVLLRRV